MADLNELTKALAQEGLGLVTRDEHVQAFARRGIEVNPPADDGFLYISMAGFDSPPLQIHIHDLANAETAVVVRTVTTLTAAVREAVLDGRA